MSLFIYIEDETLELSSDTVFALTLTKLDFNNVGSRFVNYSNSIKVPFTANNVRILGNSQDENSTSEVPYTFLSCRVVQDGVELVSDGSLLVTNSEGEFSVEIYENVVNFFQAVKNLNIRDVQPLTNTAWNAAGIDGVRATTSNVISAVLSWGKSGAIYQTNYFLPCFFYHTIVTAILEHTGLTLNGDILTDSRFKDLVIPFPNEQFSYLPEYFNVTTGGTESNPQTIEDVTTTEIELLTITNPLSYVVKATVGCNLRIDTLTYGFASNIFLNFYINGVYQTNDTLTSPTPGAQMGASVTVEIQPGDTFTAKVQSDTASLGTDIVVTYIGVGGYVDEAVDRTDVYWNNLLGTNIKCDEIIKDFFTRFGIIYKQDQGVLYLKTIEEIITNTGSVNDWSGKIVDRTKKIEYKSDYSTTNYFNYKAAEEVKTQQIGQGVLNTTAATPTEKTAFTSTFSNSITDDVGGYTVGIIPVYDSTSTGIDTFANEPGLRLMTLKSRTTESSITFNVSARTDYKLAYFVDGLLVKDTGFQYFLDQFYKSFGDSIDRAKKVTKYYNLTDSDISNYDPLKMVFDDDGYYLVNKIINYVSGKVTKVELFKI